MGAHVLWGSASAVYVYCMLVSSHWLVFQASSYESSGAPQEQDTSTGGATKAWRVRSNTRPHAHRACRLHTEPKATRREA